MIINLLAEGEVDLEMIIPPVVLAATVIFIILFVKFFRSFTCLKMRMNNSNDRMQKKNMLGKYFYRCCGKSYGRKKCPVCGKKYSTTESVTDENGDYFDKETDGKCPRCSAKCGRNGNNFYLTGSVTGKYKDRFDTLAKYISAYSPEVPDYGGDDGMHGTFIPD